jgi:two-component system, OmpR family, response regulator
MYYVETRNSRAVQTMDALRCGRILVVDDDKVFGTFVLAALESRGHDVDWAGSIQDALGSMYGGRYDLVIIDLRLPDGSGLQLLRDATDEGLLTNSGAIILTGHDDFEEPSDIRVFHKSHDVDTLLDCMADIVAATKQRRQFAGGARPASRPTLALDGHRPPRGIRLELVLYTSAASEKSQRALRTVQRVLEKYNASQVNFTIRDLSSRPSSGDEDSVVFTPTLVKRGPGPRTWIVGNLEQEDLLIDLFDVSGVDRKRDGR